MRGAWNRRVRRYAGWTASDWLRGHRLAAVGLSACALVIAALICTQVSAGELISSAGRLAGATPAVIVVNTDAGAVEASSSRPLREWPNWPKITLRVGERGRRAVPSSYFGLSTEYWAMPHYDRQRVMFERVLDLLRVPGDPFILRIGGDSADVSWWNPDHQPPAWAYAITPQWLSETSRLISDSDLRVILDLNLVARAPQPEAAWAKAFIAAMPPGSVQALELGNEPDLYRGRDGRGHLATASRANMARYFAWVGDYSPQTYLSQFDAYSRALSAAAPGVPLAGPSLARPTNARWLNMIVRAERDRLAEVTAHRYPLSACQKNPDASTYPTVDRLLSGQSSTGLAATVRDAVALSHRADLPFRLTELNAITCGGAHDVSGTFANALWAPDAMFALMRVGVDGVNMHVRVNALNAPFFLKDNGLTAKPIFYGLVMFQRMLGPGAQLLDTHLKTPPAQHVKAWAVRERDGSRRVMLINKGARGATVALRLHGAAPASVERLLAPSPTSRTGVTLAGQTLGRDGSWQGRLTVQTVAPSAGGYRVALPPYSAALVTLPG